MGQLVSTKAALHEAVHQLERVHDRRAGVGAGSLAMPCFPHAELTLRLVLGGALLRRRPTLVLSELRAPAQMALHLLCFHGGVCLEQALGGLLGPAELARLGGAAANLASAPLHFATCEPFDHEQVARTVGHVAPTQRIEVVVCEKCSGDALDAWRAALATQSRRHGLETYLLAGRFTLGVGRMA